jgi:hypothetical protein
MGQMSNEDPARGYVLVLVPADQVGALTRGQSAKWMARLTANTTVEIVGDVGEDRRLRMSREMYEQVEVIE